jgi:hypothetical protein
MRIKFEKGMTPEAIAKVFVKYMRENRIVLGAVNMYIQTYDDEMKPEKFKNHDGDFLVCHPSESTIKEYENDVVNLRRQKMKVV